MQYKTYLLDTVSEKRSLQTVTLLNLESQYSELKSMLTLTLKHGHSNSVLLQGGRATGKTMTLRKVLFDIEAESNFICVYLNGLFHTDDRYATSEIYRQLSITSGGDAEDGDGYENNIPNLAQSMSLVLQTLKRGSKENVPLLVVLEEFDLFAGHGRQTLLYNLFDICQSAQHPMAVVGLTSRMDCLDLLEKRVKSRFSHRIIHFNGASSFNEFSELVEQSLMVPASPEFNENVKNVLMADNSFRTIIRQIYDLTKDIRLFYRIAYFPISKLSDKEPFLNPLYFYQSNLDQRVDGKAQILQSVSILELCLIISMKRMLDRDQIPFNFEMIYNEYKLFALKNTMIECYSKSVAFKAFEHLLNSELIEYAGSEGKGPKEFRMIKLLVHPHQIMDVVMKFRDIPTTLQMWSQ